MEAAPNGLYRKMISMAMTHDSINHQNEEQHPLSVTEPLT